MPTDEMLIERFSEILSLITMEDGEIENNYGLKPGSNEGPAYRKGTIVALCRTSISELESSISARTGVKEEAAKIAAEQYKQQHYKGVAGSFDVQ